MPRYNFFSMRKDIEIIGCKSKENPFQWERNHGLDQSLIQRYPYGQPKKNWINILTEYCWQVYQKSFNSVGAIYIGRQQDVWTHRILHSCLIDDEEDLWLQHTKGNVLVIKKWSCVLNDFWILGGIHRYAEFHLMSYLAPQNLWDYENARHVVTARELIGLLHFGYKMERNNVLRCTSFRDACNANIISYDKLMKRESMKGVSIINRLLAEPSFGLHKQINARSK